MTTSGTTNSSFTARDVIKAALMKLGEYSALQQPKSADEQLGVDALNIILKDWQNDGVNMWRQAEYNITWPAATSESLIEPTDEQTGVNDIIELRVVTTYDRPLERWEWSDYMALPNKSQSGTPSVYSVNPERTGLRLRIWPVPTADTDLRGTVNRVIEDVTSSNQTLDLPQAYHRTLILALAAYLAPDFNKSAEKADVIAESHRLYRIMRAADRPASYYFEGAR